MEDKKLDNIIKSIHENQPEIFFMNGENLSKQQVIKLCQAIKSNASIKELNLNYCSITSDGAVLLADNLSIDKMSLTNNSIWNWGALALGINQTLKFLDLRYSRLTVMGCLALVPNTTLESIRLDGNYLGKGDRQTIIEAFKEKGMLPHKDTLNFYREKQHGL